MRTRIRLTVILLLSALAVTGCSLFESSSLREVWRLEAEVLGQPAIEDGVALVYENVDQKLRIRAVDAATGRTLWKNWASPGSIVGGISISPEIARNFQGRLFAIYLRAPETPTQVTPSVLVAADLHTGEEVWESTELEAARFPRECDNGEDACIVTYIDSREHYFRLNLDTGYFGTNHEVQGTGGVSVGSNGLVFGTYEGVTSLLRFSTVDGFWATPTADIFGTEVSSARGWSWVHSDTFDSFIGSIGEEGRLDDLTRSTVVAVDANTGELIWRRENFDLDCNMTFTVPSEGDTAIGCRYTGSAVYGDDDYFDRVDDLTVTVEGYSLRTGETLWSVDAGDELNLFATWLGRPVTTESRPLLVIDETAYLVDLDTGDLQEYTGTLWCAKTERMDYLIPRSDAGGTLLYGGSTYSPCETEPEDSAASVEIPVELLDDDVRVIAIPGALVGLR